MESYALTVSQRSGNKYATYISTPADLTCLVIKASKIKANPNSILKPTDVFVCFKGSSTLKNLWHDLKSQFTASDLGGLLQSIGVKVTMNDGKNLLTGSFVKPIVKAWSTLMGALTEHITANESRLFLCGHSLGGAYCTLFAFILAEGKVSGTIPIMSKVKSIHILSYGAPTLLSDTARNTFNRHLESGLVTLDRVVSQKIAARTSAVALTQALALGAGPNDIIPSIPAGFAHPGFRPLATEFRPEANGRPYSMDNIRKFYGVSSNTRYRDPTTWPFLEDIGLGDRKNSTALNDIVKRITNLEPPPNVDPAQEIQAAEKEASNPQLGGFGEQKGIYSAATKNHIPDYISVAGSNYAVGFAHAEYLGMFFLGGFRLAGMKNPGYGNRTANFSMYDSGVELAYVDYKANPALDTVPEAKLPAGESGDDESAATSVTTATGAATSAATSVTTAVTKGGYRTRKTRKATKARKARKMKSSRRR
jgi:pimeloyl-ACP methyl ester carboxylesterase